MTTLTRTRVQKVDTVSGRTTGSVGLVLFSLPFLGAGGYFALAGFGFLPLAGQANAPLEVIGCVGLAFFMAGAMVALNGVRGVLHRRRRRRLDERFGEASWHADYPWDATGISDSSLRRVAASWTMVVFMVVFLAPFNWWAWLSDAGGVFIGAIVGLFDLIALVVIGVALRSTAQLLQHGRTRVRYDEFPFHPGGTVRVTFLSNRYDALKATLRYVEERWETSGHGKNRSKRLMVDALWSEEQALTPHRLDVEVPIRFELPDDDALVNDLSEAPVRYWELVLEADVPGADFHATYLLPVYPARGRVSSGSSGSSTSVAAVDLAP